MGAAVVVPTRRARSETLDLLRAVAALGVVALHLAPFAHQLGYTIPWAAEGELGVQLFFVLSGYLITHAVLSDAYSRRTYAVNRTFRIMPAYLFALFVAIVINDAWPLTTKGGLQNVALHVLMLHGLSRVARVSINPVLWTLSIEWLFYGLMLLCAPGLRRVRTSWAIVAAMFAVSMLYRVWIWERVVGAAERNFYFKQLPGMLDEFACGVAAALAMRSPAVRRVLARRSVHGPGLAMGLLVVAAGVVLFRRHAPGTPNVGFWTEWYMVLLWPVVVCAGFAIVIVCLVQFERELAPTIRRCGLGFIGLCSYSLYLFHTVVIDAFHRGWTPKATVPAGIYLAFTCIGILAAAALVYVLVEVPGMAARSRFVRRRAPVAPPPVTAEGSSTEAAAATT